MLIQIIIFLLFIGSYFLHYFELYFLSSLLLLFVCFFIIIIQKKKYKYFLNNVNIFTIGFLIPFSFSLLKLSNNSTFYSNNYFILIFGSYYIFYIVQSIDLFKFKIDKSVVLYENNKKNIVDLIFKIDIFIIIISFVSLLIEIIKLQYIPIFSFGIPHAYSSFHLFGIHYIVLLTKYIPSLLIINICLLDYKFNDILLDFLHNKYKLIIILSFVYFILVSVLLVSRSLFITGLFLMILNYLFISNNKVNKKDFLKIVLILLIFICIVYIVISFFRFHNIEYLNEIFNMKKNVPLFISQPYTYITQNFENLNYLVNNFNNYTLGKKILFPLWTAYMLKNVFFSVIYTYPIIIKNELTTTTYLYDIFYDFSYIGCFIYTFMISLFYKYIYNIKNKITNNILNSNLIFLLIYSQFIYYLFLSFFQNYFVIFETYFDLVFLFILYKYFDYKLNICYTNK